ncbi:hypothetical protein NUSPORA_00899 [Nucleospora cyclopteri]
MLIINILINIIFVSENIQDSDILNDEVSINTLKEEINDEIFGNLEDENNLLSEIDWINSPFTNETCDKIINDCFIGQSMQNDSSVYNCNNSPVSDLLLGSNNYEYNLHTNEIEPIPLSATNVPCLEINDNNIDKYDCCNLDTNSTTLECLSMTNNSNENNKSGFDQKNFCKEKLLEVNNVKEKEKNILQQMIQILKLSIELSQQQINLISCSVIDVKKMKDVSFELNTFLKLELDMQQNFLKNYSDDEKNEISLSTEPKINLKTTPDNSNDKDQTKEDLKPTNNKIEATQTSQCNVSLCPNEDSINKKTEKKVLISNNFVNINNLIQLKNCNQQVWYSIPILKVDKINTNVIKIKKLDSNETNSPLENKKKCFINSNTEFNFLKEQNPSITKQYNIKKNMLLNENNSQDNLEDIKIETYGDLSSGDKEEDEIYNSEDKYGAFNKVYPDPTEKDLNNPRNLIRVHKLASTIMMLISELDFLRSHWLNTNYCKKCMSIIPVNFLIFPGWHAHHVSIENIFLMKREPRYLSYICEQYGLTKYYCLVFNIIKTNTYNHKNIQIPLNIFFHLICYFLCKKYNLGNGQDFEIKHNIVLHKYINLKNFNRVFHPKDYWIKKADILLEKTKKKAFAEFGISRSSFNSKHLFNVLQILCSKDPERVALTYYIYYATEPTELRSIYNFPNSKIVDQKKTKEKKVMIYKLIQECKDYITTARHHYFRFFVKP